MTSIHYILLFIAIYFLLVLAFVVYARVKETKSIIPTLDEFFLAGKNLNPLILAATFAASYFSTWTVLGIPGMVYAQGIGALYFIWVLDLIGIAFIFYLAPKLMEFASNNKVYSPVEIISKSYGSRGLGLLISIIFAVFLIPYISLQLVGVGAFINSYSGGEISYFTGVGSMLIIVLIYLFLGGMRAVAYTDIIQLVAILVGSAFGFFYLMYNENISLIQIFKETYSSEHSILKTPGPLGIWSVSNILVLGMISFGIHAQPHILTRYMMTKNKKDFKLLTGVLVVSRIIMSFLAIVFAMYAISKLGTGLKPNLMMGDIFKLMAESGFVGLILSSLMLMGALGAAMSTADSLLISIGQIATRDMIRPYSKVKPKKQILISKLIMFIVLILAFVAGINPPKFMVDLGVYSAAGCVILIPTILSFNSKYKSILSAYSSIIIGLILLVIFVILKIQYEYEPFGMHVGFIPMLVSFFVYYSIFLFNKYRKV